MLPDRCAPDGGIVDPIEPPAPGALLLLVAHGAAVGLEGGIIYFSPFLILHPWNP